MDKLTKTQLVDCVASKAKLNKSDARRTVTVLLDVVADALKCGKSVALDGVGTLHVRPTPAREAMRPGTLERIQVEAGRRVSFKVATRLKGGL